MKVPTVLLRVKDFLYRYFLLITGLSVIAISLSLRSADVNQFFEMNMIGGIVLLGLWVLQTKSDGRLIFSEG